MIQEEYVSFETARLLKEKGFGEKCQKVYMHNGQLLWAQIFMEGESFVNNECIELVAKYNNWTESNYAFLCPTLQMAMKWLREVHNLFIQITVDFSDGAYPMYDVCVVNLSICTSIVVNGYDRYSYKETAEAAIKYCLEHLI